MGEWDRRDFDSERYYQRKEILLDYVGRECVYCGSTKDIEFDHTDPSTKSFTLTQGWKMDLDVLLAEADKCQALCRECHQKKSDLEKSVEHGGGAAGKRGCKCDACKLKKAEYMREYKKARKIGAIV